MPQFGQLIKNSNEKMEGEIFENFADAPNIPVHKNYGCQLLRCVLI